MATLTAAELEVLSDVARTRARAEAREVVAMLEARDEAVVRTQAVEPPMRRLVERSAVPLRIGEAMGFSEGQVHSRLTVGSTVRQHAPLSWRAFIDGLIDLSRVRDIAHTINQLQRAESVSRLDATVVGYAGTHTGAELRAWLRRFVVRVEADLAVERAETERAKRHVSIQHADDGMGWLRAYLPSHELAAIEGRVNAEGRRTTTGDDARTAPQRGADQLVAWCLGSEATESSVDAQIAVTIDADVLAGAVAGFAESTDGRWAVPAGWLVDVALTGSTFWHRMVFEPVTGDVLSHEYVGRYSPETLKQALRFRDGVCQAPGCMVPAERCDADHRIPHPEGPTNAANMGPLCRRHHIFKGHGLLTWTTRQPPPAPTLLKAEIYLEHPIAMEYAG